MQLTLQKTKSFMFRYKSSHHEQQPVRIRLVNLNATSISIFSARCFRGRPFICMKWSCLKLLIQEEPHKRSNICTGDGFKLLWNFQEQTWSNRKHFTSAKHRTGQSDCTQLFGQNVEQSCIGSFSEQLEKNYFEFSLKILAYFICESMRRNDCQDSVVV